MNEYINNTELTKSLNLLIIDNCLKQKKGINFILSSMVIWSLVILIFSLNISLQLQNVLTCFSSGLLMPLAYLFSKPLHIDFQNKSNPLTKLGVIMAVNQVLYILIAMWAFYSAPDKFIMVYAIIMGAHFLPYGWLYRSQSYYAFSIIIALSSLLVGLRFSSLFVAISVLALECVMVSLLVRENKAVSNYIQSEKYQNLLNSTLL